jgi:hypothetical protein
MSYDFLMMKPRTEILFAQDLGEETLFQQDPDATVQALSALFPELAWSREEDDWFGSLQGDDTWYEFRIEARPDFAWTVRTSHRTNTRSLIPVICNALGLLAFDGQANLLIQPEKPDPA